AIATSVRLAERLAASSKSNFDSQRDGAFMEPRGCNGWQSVANRYAARRAETSENHCRRLRPVACDVHGKEGVDGSSPSEGSSRLLPHLAYVLTPAATATRIAPTPAKRQAMTRISWERLAALAGLAFVALYVAAFTLGIEVGDSDREILAYYANSGHRTKEIVAFFLIAGAALARLVGFSGSRAADARDRVRRLPRPRRLGTHSQRHARHPSLTCVTAARVGATT